MNANSLARHLGLGALTLYGIGDILGAGIYALVGKVAGAAGADTTLAFLVSGVLALLTGLSYAELAARIPHSAGACAYAARAFPQPVVSFVIGVLVLMSGVTSAATAALAFHGYMDTLIPTSPFVAALLLVSVLTMINFTGIRHSAHANNGLTLIELAGLLIVIVVGLRFAIGTHAPMELASRLMPQLQLPAILAGVTIAFYAFVGFEDLVNLAEEAKDPSRDIPRALLIAIAFSTLIYVLVVSVVLWTMSVTEAANTTRPLLEVLSRAGHAVPSPVFAIIAIVAISNTALANSIMASRLLYGMAHQRLLPNSLTRIHAGRRTPWVTILITALLTLLLVATGGVTVLAQTTGAVLMLVFTCVHASLIRVRSNDSAPAGAFVAPRAIPYVGALLCFGVLTQFPAAVHVRLILIIGGALILYHLLRQRTARVTIGSG